jgi:hypothetical protein
MLELTDLGDQGRLWLLQVEVLGSSFDATQERGVAVQQSAEPLDTERGKLGVGVAYEEPYFGNIALDNCAFQGRPPLIIFKVHIYALGNGV